MSEKRHPEDGNGKPHFDGSSCSEVKRRRVPRLRKVVREVMRLNSIQQFLEPVIRRVVKEEVELALRKHLNRMKENFEKEKYPSHSMSRSLQLQFLNNLCLPIFTGSRIEGEGCSKIEVAVVDVMSGQIVNSGAESSAKVEIVVLEGDFYGDEGDNWTLEQFTNNIVRERGGKRPLLTGDTFLNLNEGIGLVHDISLTDNSSWTRSKKFRLGARVVDSSDEKRIREAKTESFVVRDHRGELYKKHHPPSLSDEVWRLEKIAKDGAFHKRLNGENIISVEDFLTILMTDPIRLRQILGTGMSAKTWEVTINHARTCAVDKRIHLYHPPGSQQKSGVVIGRLSDNQYGPAEKLSADAHKLLTPFKYGEQNLSYDDETFLSEDSSCLNSPIYPLNSKRMESLNANKCLNSEKDEIYYPQPTIASPDMTSSIYPIGGVRSTDDHSSHEIEHTGLRYDEHVNYLGEVTNSLICDTESMTQAFLEDNHLGFIDSLCSRSPSSKLLFDDLSSVSDFLDPPSSAVGKAQRRWTKISSVLKWFSVRRSVAKKKSHVEEVSG